MAPHCLSGPWIDAVPKPIPTDHVFRFPIPPCCRGTHFSSRDCCWGDWLHGHGPCLLLGERVENHMLPVHMAWHDARNLHTKFGLESQMPQKYEDFKNEQQQKSHCKWDHTHVSKFDSHPKQ